jgi:hypothetical protein
MGQGSMLWVMLRICKAPGRCSAVWVACWHCMQEAWVLGRGFKGWP